MSMQVALGVVGGVVGAFFGYPQLGFLVGSLIGAALTPATKVEGPRLDDLKVTVSTYGVGIALLYGTIRTGGNVIFCTDKMEVSKTESQGKGGGTETTSYSYFVHMATAICEGPNVQIRKRWMDGKLVYDNSSGASIGSALASASSPFSTSIVYPGDFSQEPDPTQESVKGAGNVPAYKGVAYVQDNWLETPGGRVPQPTFEVTNYASAQTAVEQLLAVPDAPDNLYAGVVQATGIWHGVWSYVGLGLPRSFTVYYGETGTVTPVRNFQLPDDAQYQPYPVACGSRAYWFWPHQSGGYAKLDLIDAENGTRTTIYQEPGSTCKGYYIGRAAYDPTSDYFIALSYNVGEQPAIFNRQGGFLTSIEAIAGQTFQVGIDSTAAYILTHDTGNVLKLVRRSLIDGQSSADMPDTVGPALNMIDLGRQFSCLTINEHGIFALILIGDPGITTRTIYKITPATSSSAGSWEAIYSGAGLDISNPITGPSCKTFYCSQDMAITGPIPASDDYKAIRFRAMDVEAYPVADILADQCIRAGLDVDDIDVSAVDDLVQGYIIKNPASARSNIDPLLTAFAIDVREQDGKIQFIKRANQTSVATIPYVDLASHDFGDDPGDPMPLVHKQEVECPKMVSVTFLNYLDDYQNATESYTGQVTASELVMNLELPMALTPDQGATIAFRLWCDAWNARNARSLKLERKYLRLSPGDVVTVEYPAGSLSDWRLTKITDTGSLLECEGVPSDSAIYSQTAVGATSYSGGQSVDPLPSQTLMQIVDSPIIRDQDDDAGLYVAMEGFDDSWPGATLYVGDDDSDLQDRGTVNNPCPQGYAETALGSWTPNMIDGRNSVTINMGSDELASITYDRMMTTRSNLALIGDNGRWEAIQFQTVYDYGSNRYEVSGLLRGLFGTERHKGSHAIGDKFVLLAGVAGILRPALSAADIGMNKAYRAVTLGRDFTTTTSQVYANTAEGLRPYAPWDARKSKAASNDQTVTWQRRTRYSSNSLRGIIPLGETTEAYSIRFYTSSAFTTVAATKTASSKTVTITSAEQTAAGLTPGGTLYVGIRQVSDTYGSGSELQATL